jgi:hypothetical protein
MAILRHFDIRRLKPFHREGDRMPKPAPEKADKLSDLDPDLRPDEQSYVSHYLGYADVLLNGSDEETGADAPLKPSNVIELPHIEEPEQPDSDGNDKVA